MEEEPKKSRKEYAVPAEDFVKAWQESKTVDEVVQKLQMPKPIVLARASNYRSLGIKLKKMPRKGKAIDVEGLNRLIRELDAQKKKAEPPEGSAAAASPEPR